MCLKICMALLCMLSIITVHALKPRWINNTPKELNNTYKFVQVVSSGDNLEVARVEALHRLASNEQLKKAVTVNAESGELRQVDQTINNGQLNETIHVQFNVTIDIKGCHFKLQAYMVDEYAEKQESGRIKLTTLYMVAVTDSPVFDHTSISEHYGLAPMAMSLFPGAGQWYKGSKLKGALMFLGIAAGVTGVILCENQRADYHKKMIEQPQFAKTYNNKSSNWETARNVCIGATAAFYAFNLIDAAIAKGARQIKVRKDSRHSFSISPVANPSHAGITLAYHY